MVEKLRIKAIYDDFLLKNTLTKEQIEILNRLISRDGIVKISMEMGISQRSIGYEIRKLKNMYENYKRIELTKLLALFN